MKLYEVINVFSKGNKTSLTGGDLPSMFEPNVNKLSKKPRVKIKDVYGDDDGDAGSGGSV